MIRPRSGSDCAAGGVLVGDPAALQRRLSELPAGVGGTGEHA